jgi:hypothetical protein
MAAEAEMNAIIISAVISVVSFVCSLAGAAFISGVRWGEMNTRLNSIDKDMSEIKGMFRLTLRKDINDG